MLACYVENIVNHRILKILMFKFRYATVAIAAIWQPILSIVDSGEYRIVQLRYTIAAIWQHVALTYPGTIVVGPNSATL